MDILKNPQPPFEPPGACKEMFGCPKIFKIVKKNPNFLE